ncbi:MAG: hypothetical protein H0X17_03025 [Deltaproteobacteria bacterium]|nr:hypothetical protein [Deltaproteobacteria bacterium]
MRIAPGCLLALIALGLAGVLAGCTAGEEDPPAADAATTPTSDGAPGADAGIDGPARMACTNALYDPCTTNAQCTSGTCRVFSGSALQICTQACTPGDNSTCPQQAGAVVQCNTMGVCKPAAPNNCTR